MDAGKVLGERYRVERLLGSGAAAHLWAATELATGQRVAIKMARAHGDADEARRALAREATILGLVQSPHVLALREWVEDVGEGALLVTDFLDGKSLDEWADGQEYAPSLGALVPLLEQAARGLETVHAAGWVHGDVKPANLFLTAQGGVKLIDFNVARPIGTTRNAFVGTPAYMAPELWRSEPATAAADTYALAATAYVLATSSLLYSAHTTLQWMEAHLRAPSPTWSSRGIASSSSSEAALAAALAKDPASRPSPAEFVASLAR